MRSSTTPPTEVQTPGVYHGAMAACVFALEDTQSCPVDPSTELDSILTSAIDAIVTADADGVIQSWNPAAERMFGYSRREACGQPLELIIPERHRAHHRAGMQRAAKGEHKLAGHVVNLSGLRRDGTEIHIELSLSRWQHADQTMYTGIIRDVSARKKAEEEAEALTSTVVSQQDALDLTRAQLAMAESRANVGRLIAGILHEINSPLGATRSATDTLARMLEVKDRKPGRDQIKSMATVIQDGVERIDQVVEVLEQILKSSEPAKGRVDVGKCLSQVAERRAADLSSKIKIRLSLPVPPTEVCASRAQLFHVFACLIDNAAASLDGEGEIGIDVKVAGDRVLVRLVDDGCGMSETQLENACQFGFTKREGRMRMRTGLATVKAAVDAMGGTMKLASRQGVGTDVSLSLPRA